MDQAILYVEPIYLEAEASQLPELRRVIVAYGSRIAMEETLAEALAQVMGIELVEGEPPPPEPEPTLPRHEGDLAGLVLEADGYYRAAQECLKAGDWVCYGAEMDKLEQVLRALIAATEP
jgi:hypothetical protein